MAKDGMFNATSYRYDESLNTESMLDFLKEIFPERKVYLRKTVWGKFTCVNINKCNCIVCIVKSDKKKSITTVSCSNENTALGNILLGGLLGYFLSKSQSKDMMRIIYANLDKRYSKISEI